MKKFLYTYSPSVRLVFLSYVFILSLFVGVQQVSANVEANGDAESSVSASNGTANDCTGGQCGAEVNNLDNCDASGTQCYSPQYCTWYNTPRFVSPMRASAQVGQSFSYSLLIAQVDPNPTRPLSPWEHPQMREKQAFETGWFGSTLVSIDRAGLLGSGLSSNEASVVVQKKNGVEQVPYVSGLTISGVPTTVGTYTVALSARNDLEEWVYEGGGGDNQSSTFAGSSDDRYYVKTFKSCSGGDVLEIQVNQCSASATPEITSPDTITAQVGTPFSFQATARNSTSIGLSVEHLPEGTSWSSPLSITGTPTVSGTYTFSINADNGAPGCRTSAHKDVTVIVAPAPECVGQTPSITSAGSASGEMGSAFAGYTIQTSLPADTYSLTPSNGDDSFPASLGIANNGRSLEGSVASTQSKQQYHFQARASKTLPSGSSCSSVKDVSLVLTCPSVRPNWDSSSGQCTDRCTDQGANNYNQPGQCRYNVTPSVCNDPLALNPGAQGACRYNPGRVLCTDPNAINFGQTGSCQPRTGCGAGETGSPPSCREIPCPTCGSTKMCNVCAETDRHGACVRHEMRPAEEAKSNQNSCGLTRSTYFCPGESSDPPPPPGEQACAQPLTVVTPDRQLIQKGSQCTIPWRVSGVPAEQTQSPHPLICVISGPNFSVRANGPSGQVVTPNVDAQSVFKFVCRNGDAKVSNEASFTCRVNPRYQER